MLRKIDITTYIILMFLSIGCMEFNHDETLLGVPKNEISETCVGPLQSIYTGTDTPWSGNPREFIQIKNSNRIRQSGNITSITFYCKHPENLSMFRFTVWRTNGTNYDRIYISKNLTPYISNGLNTINLSEPVPVKEGDYYGYQIHDVFAFARPSFYVNSTESSGLVRYTESTFLNDTVALNYNWEEQSAIERTLVIKMNMNSPGFIAIGDSITAGHPIHYPYIESTTKSNISKTYEYKLGSLMGTNYQNMGIGGQTTTDIKARFYKDALNQTPGFVLLMAGVNDVSKNVPKNVTLSNIEYMLSESKNKSQAVVLVSILPWTGANTTRSMQIDDLNEEYEKLAYEYGAIWVDVRKSMGVERVGQFSGNLWNLNASYTDDGCHLNDKGNEVFANAIYNSITILGFLSISNSNPLSH